MAPAVDVERVGVAHDELAGPQEAEAGAGLVAELDLDLVHGEGQLPVGVDLGADGDRHHLLVGGAEDEGAASSLDDHRRQGVAAEEGGPPALFPQLDGVEGREQQLLAAGRVELLTDDALDPLQHPEPQREEGVDARSQPPDVAGPDEQLMAGHFGVGRRLAQGARRAAGTSAWAPILLAASSPPRAG